MSEPEAGAAGYCLADVNHRVVDCDEKYLSILQRERSEVVGRHALDLTFQIDRDLNADMLNRMSSSGAAFAITKRYVRGDGSLIWVTNHVAPVRGSGTARCCAISRQAETPVSSAGLAHNIRAVRRLGAAFAAGKTRIGADVIAAPCAEILLKLYAAELEGCPMTGDDLAQALGMSTRTILRWLLALVQRELVEVEHGAPATVAAYFRIARRCELAFDEIIALSAKVR